jgi:hypothetical protein
VGDRPPEAFPPGTPRTGPDRSRGPRGLAIIAAFAAVLLAVGLVTLWTLNRPSGSTVADSPDPTGPATALNAIDTPTATSPTEAQEVAQTGTPSENRTDSATATTGTLHLVIDQPSDGVGGSVLVEPGGHTCQHDCTLDYALPTKLTLSGKPNRGYLFTPWSGSTCSDVTPCVLRMPDLGTALTVHAGFAKGLLVTVTIQGNGQVSSTNGKIKCSGPGTCAHTFKANTSILLRPGDLNTFSSWTGCTDRVAGGGCGVSGVSTGTVHLVARFTATPPTSPDPSPPST